MPVRIESVLGFREINAGLTVLPMHANTMQKPLTLHPALPDLCKLDYPAAYSYYKYAEADGLKRGDFILLERIDVTDIGIMIGRGDPRRKFDLYAITKALRRMADLDLHNKYTIAFPALGFYKEDGIDIKNVYKMVKKLLGNGSKTVYFVLNY